jgi:hypothetical protein
MRSYVLRWVLLGSLVSLTSCKRSGPVGDPAPSPDVKPAASQAGGPSATTTSGTAVFEKIAWAPADTRVVAWFWTKSDPLFLMAKQLFKGHEPACLVELRAATPMRWSLQRDVSDVPVTVFATGMVRADVEACLRTMSGLTGKPAKTERDGAITKLSSGEWSTYLGFGRDGYVLWHDDRSRLAEVLSYTGITLGSDAGMKALVVRADPTSAGGWASTIDLGTSAVGSRSLGLMANTSALADGGTRLHGVVIFANDEDATRAVEGVARRAREAKDARERMAWRELRPVAKGREVEVDFSVIAEKETLAVMAERLSVLRDGG